MNECEVISGVTQYHFCQKKKKKIVGGICDMRTHIQTSESYHKIWIKKKKKEKKKEKTANQQRYGQPIHNVSVENIYGILGITDLSQERDMECGISLRIFCHFLSISVFLWAIGVAAVFDFRWNCLCCRRKNAREFYCQLLLYLGIYMYVDKFLCWK